MSTVFAQISQHQSHDFIEDILDFLLESTEDLLYDDVFSNNILKLCTMVDDPSYSSFSEAEDQRLILSDNSSKKEVIRQLHPAHANCTCCKEFLLHYIDNLAPAAELTHVFDERSSLLKGNEQRFWISNQMDVLPQTVQRQEVSVVSIFPQNASSGDDKAIPL